MGNLTYSSQPTTFQADVSTAFGPVPGTVSVPTTGRSVSFTGLTYPGLCRIANLDSTNYVIYGIYDGVAFFPLGEILPGETYVLRLWRYFGAEYQGTGTGTPSDVNYLHLRADTASCAVAIEAFER